ncbi:MAG: sensor domain-containing diguanylate cyclase [Desulfovibrionaceae bacterium]
MILSILNYQTSSESMREEILTSSLPLIRENIYSEIRSSLIEPILVSGTMANDAFVRAWTMDGERDTDEMTRYLRDIRNKYSYFSVFFVSAKTNRYYHYQGIHKIISPHDAHDVWYYSFLNKDREYLLDVDSDEVSGGILTIFINHRVEDYKGNLLGVTGVGVRMDNVAEMLRQAQEKYRRRVYLVDESGLVQAHSDKSRVEEMDIRDEPGLSDISSKLLALRDEPGNFEYESEAGRVLLTCSYVPELNWYLIVEQDEDDVLAATRGNLVRTLGGGFAATLLVLMVSVLAVNHFQSRLERMTVTDELTGAANRRRFSEQYKLAMSRVARSGQSFSLILMDLDGFKAINDKAGHLAGDRILCEVAELIREQVRPTDLLARWGGDEFIVLTESGLEQALVVAERIRAAVKQAAISCVDGSDCVTVSLGVAEYCEGEAENSLTHRADEALYEAKRLGRNRVLSAKK